MLVLIPCGGKKREMPCPAGNLYIGSYFKGCLGYALSITEPPNILILSAKYGLLALGDRVSPYDLRMGSPGCVTAQLVREQAETRGVLTSERVVALGGVDYLDVVREVWPLAETPMVGTGGIGKQLKWLGDNTKRK